MSGRPRGVHKRPERPIYSDRSRSGRIHFGSRRGFRRPNQAGGNNRSGKLDQRFSCLKKTNVRNALN